MKNKLFIIISIIIIVGLLFLSFFLGEKNSTNHTTELSNDPEVIIANAQKESAAVKENEKKDFIMIDVEQYLDYCDDEDVKIILLAKPTCSYSVIAYPIIQNLMYDYDLDVYYLNIDEQSHDDMIRFAESNEVWNEGIGTPRLYLIKNNSIIDMVMGLTDRNHYIDFLISNGLISKE